MSQADTAPVEHADSGVSDQETAKQIIAQILALRPGPENAISGKDLAERTPVSYSTVKDLIRPVIEEYRIPITDKRGGGYYRLRPDEDHDEFIKTIERYKSQAESSRERAKLLASVYNGHQQAGDWP